MEMAPGKLISFLSALKCSDPSLPSPYTCEMSADATGTTFTPMTVITNVPGTNSRSRAKATDFPLVAQAAPGAACTGGPNGDACIVRCRNAARAGPFGGCAVVTNAVPLTPAPVAAPAAPIAAPAAPVAPVAAPVAPVAQPSASLAPVSPAPVEAAPVTPPVVAAPVAQPVAPASPVQAPAASSPAQALPVEEDKRSLLDSVANLFAKRDHSRKRMVGSRVVGMQRRGQWI